MPHKFCNQNDNGIIWTYSATTIEMEYAIQIRFCNHINEFIKKNHHHHFIECYFHTAAPFPMLTKESGTWQLWMHQNIYWYFAAKSEPEGGKICQKRAVDFLLSGKLVVFPWRSTSRESFLLPPSGHSLSQYGKDTPLSKPCQRSKIITFLR